MSIGAVIWLIIVFVGHTALFVYTIKGALKESSL